MTVTFVNGADECESSQFLDQSLHLFELRRSRWTKLKQRHFN